MIHVFILNVGRSGSRSTATAYGFKHEPDGESPSVDAVRSRSKDKIIYGETSHWWKNHLATLNDAFPNSDWIHLVRNGRDVVRSFLGRGYYTGEPESEAARQVLPPHRSDMTPLEKICHYWTYWNSEIEDWTGDRVRLEDLKGIPHLHKSESLVEWEPAMEHVFMGICGEMMGSYGYQ